MKTSTIVVVAASFLNTLSTNQINAQVPTPVTNTRASKFICSAL